MEKETQKPVAAAFWLFTTSNTGATTAGERSTWECAGIYSVYYGMFFLLAMVVGFFLSFPLMRSLYHIVGCQDRNRKDAYSNGGHWIREKEAGTFV